MRKRQPKIGECCSVMKLVLSRELPASAKAGLALEPWLNFTKGTQGVALVLHFPKSKDRSSEHASATYALVSYCPFCGAKTERKT